MLGLQCVLSFNICSYDLADGWYLVYHIHDWTVVDAAASAWTGTDLIPYHPILKNNCLFKAIEDWEYMQRNVCTPPELHLFRNRMFVDKAGKYLYEGLFTQWHGYLF